MSNGKEIQTVLKSNLRLHIPHYPVNFY